MGMHRFPVSRGQTDHYFRALQEKSRASETFGMEMQARSKQVTEWQSLISPPALRRAPIVPPLSELQFRAGGDSNRNRSLVRQSLYQIFCPDHTRGSLPVRPPASGGGCVNRLDLTSLSKSARAALEALSTTRTSDVRDACGHSWRAGLNAWLSSRDGAICAVLLQPVVPLSTDGNVATWTTVRSAGNLGAQVRFPVLRGVGARRTPRCIGPSQIECSQATIDFCPLTLPGVSFTSVLRIFALFSGSSRTRSW